jgi:TIR domain
VSHVFVSYAHDDEAVVGMIASDLVSHGFDVWWDRRLQPGSSFNTEIDRALRSAGCVLVVWSRHSVDSQWVQAEAEVGRSSKTVLPIRIDDTPVRVPFQLLQTLDLSAGNGAFTAAQLAQLRTVVRVFVEPAASPATAASPPLAPPVANEDEGAVGAFLHPDEAEAPRLLAQANGVPPLTEHVVMQLAGMYGWANGIDVTAAQVTDLAQRLVADWQTGNMYGISVALQGCAVGSEAQTRLVHAPETFASMRIELSNWLLDRQADLRECGYCQWMTAVAFAQPDSSESSHDAYVALSNVSLAGHIARMQSLGAIDPTRRW